MSNFALFVLGLLLLPALLWFCQGASLISLAIAAKLLLAAMIGLLLRSVRRGLFFRGKISWHRSFSYEVVVQVVQVLSPLLPKRAFETAFLERESPEAVDTVAAWVQARVSTVPAIIIMLFALLLLIWGKPALALLVAILAVVALFWAVYQWHQNSDVEQSLYQLMMVGGTGLLVWSAEIALFVWATDQLLPGGEAMMLYLLFTGIFELSIIPFAIGVAELPALLATLSGYGMEALGVLLAWHVMRLLPVLLFSFFYLPRYKMSFRDLMYIDIIARVCQSQRPAGGWPYPRYHPDRDVYLSIVIPAYNEAQRLPSFLQDVKAYVDACEFSCEVLVVDDGSSDDTAARVEAIQGNFPELKLLRQVPNQGKGRAVQRGVLAAKGYYILFSDADGATPIGEADRLLAAVAKGSEIAIGSRRQSDSDVERERKGVRALMGMFFYAFVNVLAVPRIKDTQCGFKLFRRDVAHHIFQALNEGGWAFDVEILYRAQLASCDIREVPVNWREIEGSKVDPMKDAIRMLMAVFRIRRHLAGYMKASLLAHVSTDEK